MIDTIVLRIHNITKYPKIYEQFYSPQEKKGSITKAYVNTSTGEIDERTFFNSTIFHDTGRVLPFVHRSNKFIASSHYNLSYILAETGDYLEFNFSIPKYEFGTNVIQFINWYDQSSHVMFLELMSFIKKFLKENFLHTPLFNDVEINRIDLCYNQMFNSKNDALHYLDEQKKLLVKYARSSRNNYRSYDTSLMYTTRRYSFKIYHKGTEFEKKDKRELEKKNPKFHDIQYLQDQADNILRYEMTFRSSMLNYLAQHFFNVSKKQVNYAVYNDHPYTKFCRFVAQNMPAQAFDNYVRVAKKFMILSEFDICTDTDEIYRSLNITFDQTVFTLCFNTFREKIMQYQIVNAVSVAGVVDRINDFNANNTLKNKLRFAGGKKSNLSKFRLVSAAILVMKGIKLAELKEYIPERSMRRLKADLKKIGITDNQADISVPKPRTDYFDYKIFFKQFHFKI